MTQQPPEQQPQPPPIRTLNDEAVAAHEVYQSLRRAGFNRWAALWLTACLLKDVPLPGWFAAQLKSTEDEA